MNRRCELITLAGLIGAAMMPALPALASDSASLTGTVFDPSGSRIPGVVVIVRNGGTSLRQSATTGNDGFYAFPNLAPGSYELRIDHPGFRPYRRTDLQIGAAAALSLDLTLELGARTDEVTVSAGDVVIETASSQAGEIIEGSKMTAVPLNGRSFTDLLALQPGVIPMSAQPPNAVVMAGVTSTPPSGGLNPGNVSVSGQRETANGFIVNGGNVEEAVNMGSAIIPNLDSPAEFRILTNNFDAEYGNHSGGQVLVVTKSGTNQLHGNAFEFLRNTDLDARNFFSADRAQFNQNQFGGTLGGPLKRDQVFFFGDYQGTRMSEGVDTGLIQVPSMADRSGNLHDLSKDLTGTVNGRYWADAVSIFLSG